MTRIPTDTGPVGEDMTRLLARALDHHRQGRRDIAREGYRQVLLRYPNHVDALNFLGVLEQETGDIAAAVAHLKTAARLDPDNEIVLNNLGNALKAQGHAAQAEACYRRAVAICPDDPDAVVNLATLLHGAGRLDEALDGYRRALDIAPDDPMALTNMAGILQARGEAASAETAYRRVLARQPGHLRALVNLAALLSDDGRHDEAAGWCRRALAAHPDNLDALLCRGRVHQAAGRLDEAEAACRTATTRYPGAAAAHFNLGNVLKDMGRFSAAGDCYRRAIDITPDHAGAWCNLGSVHREAGRNTEAMTCYEKAVSIDPSFAAVYNNMSILLAENGRIGEALACCRKAQDHHADFAESFNNTARCLKYSGRAEESLAWYRKSLALSPQTAFVHSNLLYCLSYLPPRLAPPEAVYLEHRQWEADHGVPARLVCRNHPVSPEPDRPLRVGYLSPDFRRHPVAVFMTPVLAAHDPARVRSVCFSDVRNGDAVTDNLRGLAGDWVETAGLSDAQVAEAIRDRGIDILVDLAGHTAGNRMPLFTRRPAPIQVTYLGYPNTTGLSAMDYRITDGWADPPGQTEAFHSETLVRLPQGFLCYDPPAAAPPVMTPPCADTGAVTFGSFNNLAKFNADVADLWSRILAAVPRSRLLIKFKTLSDPAVRGHVAGIFAARGIGAERLDLHGFLPSPNDHFALYHQVDIALDTFPYNGTTTTCEALWMGVPVIALAGKTHAARVGVSILTGMGLEDLVAQDPEGYLYAATALASDPARLAKLRSALRPRMAAAPITDGPGFARRLEAAYRTMWHRWCKKNADSRIQDAKGERGESRQG